MKDKAYVEKSIYAFWKKKIYEKKEKCYSEIIYFIAITFMSLGIALVSLSKLGLSMVVAPAYIISEKIDGLTFGRAEYMVQGMVFLCFVLLRKR